MHEIRWIASRTLLLFALWPSGNLAAIAEDITFNRDILPILSNNCFACHGPDRPARKAELRLDVESFAKHALPSGGVPIAPGDPDASLILSRILSSDSEVRMPPPDSGKSLSNEEKARLRTWIAQGAPWEKHWALIPPERPELPAVSDGRWPRNALDHFILAKLDEAELMPSPEANRYTLLRRASLALTGLPPDPGEIEAFVQDPSSDAYEQAVDRLLASPRYGEHLARYWLDMARYADTNGYAADIERTMWRYRDWVIAAFNDNMPFDQFTIEQLAGDLLPNPTLEQRIATGFNRNHPIMMEGGAIFEEYRVMNVVDRVDTTATTWLGLTLKCAQCHDHKYDPISQKEFYALYAFFNSISEEESRLFGTERDGNSVPRMLAPLPEQQAELDRIDAALRDVQAQKRAPHPELDAEQQEWEFEARKLNAERWQHVPLGHVSGSTAEGHLTLEGALEEIDITALRLLVTPPSGATVTISELAFYPPQENSSAPSPVPIATRALSKKSIANALDGKDDSVWAIEAGSTADFVPHGPLVVAAPGLIRLELRGDNLEPGAVALLVSRDPAFRPAILGPWLVNGPHVAATGDEALALEVVTPGNVDLAATDEAGNPRWVPAAKEFTDGKQHALPGKTCSTWLHRTIDAPSPRAMDLQLNNRNAVRLWVNGRLVLDKPAQRGEVGPHPAPVTIALRAGANEVLVQVADFYDFNAHTFYFERTGEETGPVPREVELALDTALERRTAPQQNALRLFYRSRQWDGWAALNDTELDLAWARLKVEESIPTTMVMEELESPRPAHILIRGQYDQPGETVTPGVPAALNPWLVGGSADRLGLAQWLVAPENPLTARVVVNRLWQQVFGEGLVRTPDDFGVQGAYPSHPALLDWLATEYVGSGWDTKALFRLMVTSATFRQASPIRPELATADPENRLLARGPRFRLDAEMIRDSALAASGLLVERLGGPSVKPYQPAGLWRDVAYGGGGLRYTAQEFIQDHGDKLYRRSLYTFWKRAAAPPGMLVFDAPNRDICTARRSRSNTPLQALVLMNDTQYVEAARKVAERVLGEGGDSMVARIHLASLLTLGRPPRPAEASALEALYATQQQHYDAAPEMAIQLLQTGEAPSPNAVNGAELAAWTMVLNALLNSDAAMSQN